MKSLYCKYWELIRTPVHLNPKKHWLRSLTPVKWNFLLDGSCFVACHANFHLFTFDKKLLTLVNCSSHALCAHFSLKRFHVPSSCNVFMLSCCNNYLMNKSNVLRKINTFLWENPSSLEQWPDDSNLPDRFSRVLCARTNSEGAICDKWNFNERVA